MIPPSLLRIANSFIDQMSALEFNEEEPSYISFRPPVDPTCEKVLGCVFAILQGAATFISPESKGVFFNANATGRYIDVFKVSLNEAEGRLSAEFIKKLKKASHIYLHYLYQGWRVVADTPEAVKLEKKKYPGLINGECFVLGQFIMATGFRIGAEPFHRLGGPKTTVISGLKTEISQFLDWIRREADAPIVKCSPALLIKRRKGSIRDISDEANKEAILNSQFFL